MKRCHNGKLPSRRRYRYLDERFGLVPARQVFACFLSVLLVSTLLNSTVLANEKIEPSLPRTGENVSSGQQNDAEQSGNVEEGNARVQVAFGRDCEKLLIAEINRAETEVLVAIYIITRRRVALALVRAVARGAKVRVKYDSEQYEWQGMKQSVGYLKKRGVECIPVDTAGRKYAKMHHKFTVIDRKCVLTGSYNYTTSASMVNYENLALIRSEAIAKAFVGEFERIRDLPADKKVSEAE